MLDRFDLTKKVVLITGGAGLLGVMHAEAIAEAGGTPVLLDLDLESTQDQAKEISKNFSSECLALMGDVTNQESVKHALEEILRKYGRVDVIINNAALNPKIQDGTSSLNTNLENLDLDIFNKELEVGLTGSIIVSKIFGTYMAGQGKGVIINISSDLGIIAPDQRIYSTKGVQSFKPVSYSVLKHGIIGLTRYLSTYWAHKGIRTNALCPGGVFDDQPEEFVAKLNNLIPLGRMAERGEYKGAIQFLSSDASSYMNGSILVIDGGRTAW